MTWVKLDDGFPDHPKVLQLTGAQAWMYVSGLCYCGRFLTDGFIPQAALAKLTDTKTPTVYADRLVAVGLWDVVDGGWLVHDYADHQRTKERVQAAREAARRRQSRSRHAVTDGVSHGEVRGGSDEEVTEPYTDSLPDATRDTATPLTREQRVDIALGLLADGDVTAYRDGGGTIHNLRAFRAKCLAARKTDHGSELHGLAHEHLEWTPDELADAALGQQAPAPVTPLRAVRTSCDECGWNAETHEQPHPYVHAEYMAEEAG